MATSKLPVIVKCIIGILFSALLAGIITFVILKHEMNKETHPSERDNQPNIIIFIADDLGWDDVSFHGNDQIPTPNLDAFASHGVILNSLYSAAVCTPSRGALLTGKLPLHIGLQEHNILNGVYGSGLPLDHTLMPEYFRALGYETHLIGKWHLGFYKESLLPTNRGFDSHYGMYSESGSYFSHNYEEAAANDFGFSAGYDFHLNGRPDFSAYGHYVTDLLDNRFEALVKAKAEKPLFIILSHLAPHGNEPGELLQPPPSPPNTSNPFNYIINEHRTKYARLVKSVDDSFGKMVEVLSQNGILGNSVILFMSDNGGEAFNAPRYPTGGSNFPFRGAKSESWQGGLRVPAFIWSPLLEEAPYVNSKLYHYVDILPTLHSVAGGNTTDLVGIDGENVWESLNNRSAPSPRDNILLTYDRDSTINYPGYSAIVGKYKLVSGRSKMSNASNYYLAAGNGLNDIEELENRRLHSKAHSVLVHNGYVKGIEATWRNEAVVKCHWGNEVRCNGGECEPLMKSPTGNDFIEVEVIPVNETFSCDFTHQPCLFDLENDPCETLNLGKIQPEILQNLIDYINTFEEVEPVSPISYAECFDMNADPIHRDPPVWQPWAEGCDDLLNEQCPKHLPRSDDSHCPPGGRIAHRIHSHSQQD